MVDLRFGPGTWQSIVDERARRIQEARQAELKAKKEAQRKHQEFLEQLQIGAGITIVGLIALGFLLFAMVSMAAVAFIHG